MGCLVSTPRHGRESKGRSPDSLGEVAVFLPVLRIPKSADLSVPLGHRLPKKYLERLSALRIRLVVIATEEAPAALKARRTETETQLGGSALSDLWQSLEEYLPVLLRLVKEGSQTTDKVQFVWINQNTDSEETCISDAWYEVLSVLHLMAILSLSEVNLLLLPKTTAEGRQATVSEENKRSSIDVFLKAAGYVDCAVRDVLPQIPLQLRKYLPLDLSEGLLRALCQQALAQAVDVQLGMAIDCPKATLAVKRRLACEMVKHWQQAQDNVSQIPFSGGWGFKYQLYIKWKHVEAKAAAYYFHGLILDEGNTEKSYGTAVVAVRAAEEFLKESKRGCEAFNSAPPLSRSRRYLSEKIPKDAQSMMRRNREFYSHGTFPQMAPPLPDFVLALKPDEYRLPPPDPSWDEEDQHRG
ncbi:unnamed protein product [Spirodela intermedia]|uniref:BRO1 domain-containing protein n=1 Tax=Spirodela intermedia TaxID=51605 RepID=A0A7I8ID66_SPIIN|nr:unnamed protein product [Spirodela intermedia]CAA6655720.1 unnamed protein product [Spirodela intermedia]